MCCFVVLCFVVLCVRRRVRIKDMVNKGNVLHRGDKNKSGFRGRKVEKVGKVEVESRGKMWERKY